MNHSAILMSLALRRIIFYISTIVFLVTAPLIIGYTAGYRYHFKQRRIVKTGGLFIATDPKDALIDVNGVRRRETTPASILNLTPGDYRVRVTKDGYWPWEKRLPVESERLTFANSILLLKNERANLVALGDISHAAIAPRDNVVFYRSGDDAINELWMQKDESTPTLLWRSSGKPRMIGAVSRASSILMLSTTNTSPVIVSHDKNVPPLDLGRLINPPFVKPLFDLDDYNIIYGITKGTLTAINTKTKVVRPIIADVRDYVPTKNGLLIITEHAKPELVRIHGETISRLATLERGATELFEPIESLQPYWDSARGETMIIDLKKSDTPLVARLPGKIIASASVTDDLAIITATDHEIWRTVLRSNRAELITRVSDPILATYLHPAGRMIVYATTNRVRATELDDRDGRGIIDLATDFSTIESAALSRDGSYFIIAGTKNATRGLWKLVIR